MVRRLFLKLIVGFPSSRQSKVSIRFEFPRGLCEQKFSGLCDSCLLETVCLQSFRIYPIPRGTELN